MVRVIITAVAAVGALALGGFVFGLFMDWEGTATRLAQGFKEYTGYTLTYESASGRLLPSPSITLANARLYEEGSLPRLDIRAAEARIAIPLVDVLFGDSAPSEISFLEPDISIERHRPFINDSVKHLPLAFHLINGTLNILENGKKKSEYAGIYLDILPRASSGPFDITGKLQTSGHTVTYIGQFATIPHGEPADFAMQFDDGQNTLGFRGAARIFNDGEVRLVGHFRATAPSLLTVLPWLSDHWAPDQLTEAPLPNLAMEGDIKLAQGKVAMQNVNVTAGGETFEYTLVGKLSPPTAQIKLDIHTLRLDPLLPVFGQISRRTGDKGEYRNLFSDDTALQIGLQAQQILWRDQPLKGVSLRTDLSNGVWTVHQLKGLMPGESPFVIAGVIEDQDHHWVFNGKTQAQGQNMRDLLTWQGVDLSSMNPKLLGPFTLDSNTTVTPEYLRFSEGHFRLDAMTAKGAVILKYPNTGRNKEKKPLVETSLVLEGLDFDAYLPPSSFLMHDETAIPDGTITPAWIANPPLLTDGVIRLMNAKLRGQAVPFLQTRIFLRDGRFQMTDLQGTVGQSQLAGAMTLESAANRPSFNGKITSQTLVWQDVMNFLHAGPYKPAHEGQAATAGSENAYWPTEPIDLRILDAANGSLELTAANLILEKNALRNLSFRGQLSGQKLTGTLQGAVHNGLFEAEGTLMGGTLPNLDASVAITEMRLGPIVQLATGINALDGTMSTSMKIKTVGVSPQSMLTTMEGTGSLVIRDFAIDGFNLNAVSRKTLAARTVSDVQNLSRVALTGGQTSIQQFEAKLSIVDGAIQFPVTDITTDYTRGVLQGTIDLPRMLVNLRLSFTPRTADEKTIPDVHLSLQGSAEQPSKRLDTAEMENYIARRTVE